MKIILISISFFAFLSCSSPQQENKRIICTKEQIKEFNSCKKGFNGNFEKFKNKYPNINIPDSALLVMKDVEQLSLDEIVEKHNLNQDQIDQLISAVCITSEVSRAYEDLDAKLKNSDSIIVKSKLDLDEDFKKLNEMNIKPVKTDESQYYNIVK